VAGIGRLQVMPISWMRSADVYPDARYPPDDFIAFDGAEIVGGVYRISHSTQEGLWFWTMTVSRPGPSFNDRNGSEVRRGDAGRRVVEAYEAMLRRSRNCGPVSPG
jgi:hypothetical protein